MSYENEIRIQKICGSLSFIKSFFFSFMFSQQAAAPFIFGEGRQAALLFWNTQMINQLNILWENDEQKFSFEAPLK